MQYGTRMPLLFTAFRGERQSGKWGGTRTQLPCSHAGRIPLMGSHVDASVEEEGHALALQQAALAPGIAGADGRAQPAAPLHDALPGYACAVRIPLHRPAHDPGAARRPQQLGNLAVSRHLAPWDLFDEGVDAVEESGAARPVEPTCLRSMHPSLAGLPLIPMRYCTR